MKADNEVLERKIRETEAMRQRVAEMEEVKGLMEKQVKDYTIYEVSYPILVNLTSQPDRETQAEVRVPQGAPSPPLTSSQADTSCLHVLKDRVPFLSSCCRDQ